MFRKSVTFFILLALLWVMAWSYVPDLSPERFSFSDVMRGLLLWFSFLAFAFALLMLIIRYKGLDLASRFIPHAGFVLWLGKHAYEYSQPKTILYCRSIKTKQLIELNVATARGVQVLQLPPEQIKPMDLGYITTNPILSWQVNQGAHCRLELEIKEHLKKLGRNVLIDVTINGNELNFTIR